MKGKLFILVALLGLLLVSCGIETTDDKNLDPDEIAANIENAMYEVLGDDLQKLSQHEVVATIKYAHEDGKGHGINYRIIKSTYYEADPNEVVGLNQTAISVLFNPDSADEVIKMSIQDWPGALYRVGELSYLCFTYSPEVTYVLEYNPNEIADSEILKMAESAQPFEG